uniref:Uncharacterized protein n=1 Tax=Anguilla anguilla TaxID=7936 RepID=A0A0E9XUY4_ANGAN
MYRFCSIISFPHHDLTGLVIVQHTSSQRLMNMNSCVDNSYCRL